MTEPYGPFKPAFLTVNFERMKRFIRMQEKRDGFVPHRRYAVPLELGITGMLPVSPTHVRLTFRDDYAAAEFALRYA